MENLREEGKWEVEAIKNKATKEKKDLLDQCFYHFKVLNLLNCYNNFRLGWLEALKSSSDLKFSNPDPFDALKRIEIGNYDHQRYIIACDLKIDFLDEILHTSETGDFEETPLEEENVVDQGKFSSIFYVIYSLIVKPIL